VNILLKNQSVSVNLHVNNASSKYDKKVSAEISFQLPPGSWTPVMHLEICKSLRIFEKNLNFATRKNKGHKGR
jgi:hypothetical protein